MGVVFNLKSGQDYPPEKYSNIQKGTLYLTGASNLDGERIIENRWTETPSVIAPYGSLLLVCKGSGVGKMCFMSLPQAHIARQLQAIIPFTNDIDVRYVRYVLESRLREITKQANGVIPGISRDAALTFLLPVPPYNEQKRIIETMLYLSPMVERFGEQYDKLELLNKQITVQLKKSILQQAIQGHLVSQNPNDGCADDLLSQIDQEKRNLLKAGRLKKQDLSFSKIFKGDDNKYYETISGKSSEIELPYSFPESWAIVRLQHICSLLDGEKKVGDGICLDAKYLRGKSSGDHLQSGKFVHKGDNIILVDGENSGEVFTVPIDGYMGSTFKQLWISESLYVPYVLACLHFYKDELRNSKKGAAIPHLNKDIFRSLLIGLPPKEEQIRIVRRLDKINNNL